jgi:hypothetical protein
MMSMHGGGGAHGDVGPPADAETTITIPGVVGWVFQTPRPTAYENQKNVAVSHVLQLVSEALTAVLAGLIFKLVSILRSVT